MSSFVKEELGRVPGRFVISAVRNDAVIWQRETDFWSKDAVASRAARVLASASHEALGRQPTGTTDKFTATF